MFKNYKKIIFSSKVYFYLGLLLVILLFPLVSLGVLLVVHTDDEEELSLLFVDVVTMELVEDDKDDMEPTDGGGGKMFGLTGYL